MKFGIDISTWQRGLDLKQAMDEGVTFAIIKFGGADCGKYKDSQAETFYAKAQEIGLPVGAYFFAKCTSEAEAIEEAKYFQSIIKGKTFPCKVWYDIEGTMGSLLKERLNAIAKAFCNSMVESGYDCGVYANASTFNKIDYDGSFSAKYPKWVAYWGKTKPTSVKEGIDMWQFGGETNLIRSNKICGKTVDQNYCYFDFGTVTPVVPSNPKVRVASPTLSRGCHGEEVKILQSNLLAIGIELPKYGADGWYGTETFNGVKELQKKGNLVQDGIYGKMSYAYLNSLLNS